jgi:hypothetical protein
MSSQIERPLAKSWGRGKRLESEQHGGSHGLGRPLRVTGGQDARFGGAECCSLRQNAKERGGAV